MWMEAEIQKRVPLSLMTMQAKARNLSEDLKRKYPEEVYFFHKQWVRFHGLNNIQVSVMLSARRGC
jgi:hypothetical protein